MTVKAAITSICLNIKKLVKILSQKQKPLPKNLIKVVKNIYQNLKYKFISKKQTHRSYFSGLPSI